MISQPKDHTIRQLYRYHVIIRGVPKIRTVLIDQVRIFGKHLELARIEGRDLDTDRYTGIIVKVTEIERGYSDNIHDWEALALAC